MFKLSIQNAYGRTLQLTDVKEYDVESIIGLDPPDARLFESKNTTFDGNKLNDTTVDDRLITITLKINGNAEKNRLKLYDYLKIKQKHRIFYSNSSRSVYIDGILQSMPIGIFDKSEMTQISFVCNEPYFKDFVEIDADLSNISKLFEFPFEIETPIPFSEIQVGSGQLLINKGDVETGMKFKMYAARGAVENPVIYNLETGEMLKLNTSMDEGDEIDIVTIFMNKEIKRIRNLEETNLINRFDNESTWLQLRPGGNTFLINADSGAINLDVYVDVNVLYQGV